MGETHIGPETKKEYTAEEEKYFKNLKSPIVKGMSAADAKVADSYLPSEEKQYNMEQRLEKGFTKTSRSGSFTDKPNASPAIFPSGMKFASDFIDEMTPGKYQPQEAMKPLKEQTRAVEAPKAAAIIGNICIDCTKKMDITQAFCPSLFMIMESDTLKLFAMGVQFGDAVLGVECADCFNKAAELGKNTMPLALVKGGQLTSFEDINLALKYNFPVNLHDGNEVTLGQWELTKRRDRIQRQMEEYLIAADKSSDVFRRNKEKHDA